MLDTAIDSRRPELGASGIDPRWLALATLPEIKRPNDSVFTATRTSPPLTPERLKRLRRELVRAWRALQVLDLRAAIKIAEQVESCCGSLPGFDADSLRGTAQVIRASVYALSGDATAACASASTALGSSLSPAQRRVARTICRYGTRHSSDIDGDYIEMEYAGEHGPYYRGNMAQALDLCIDAALALRQLRLTPANWIASEALKSAAAMVGKANTAEVFALTILAGIHYEGGDLPQTEAIIERIMQRPKDSLPLESLMILFPLMARLSECHGVAHAMRHLAEGESVGEQRGCARLVAICLRERVELLTKAGELVGARQCLQRLENVVNRQTLASGASRVLLDAELVLASTQVELAVRPSSGTVDLLRHLQTDTLDRGDIYGSVRIGVRLVDALHRTGAAEEAARLLLDLLRIGAKTGLLQTYLEGGPGVRNLLRDMHGNWRSTGVEVALLVRVIMWRLRAPARPVRPARKRLDGFLPARQQAVLELIGKGRSNKEIARALNLAPETVKSYVKHIFNKLGTQTRAESVACAAKLGLLS